MSKRKEITTWTFSPPSDFNYGDMNSRPLRRPPCEHRWISVNERLPDDETELLVAWAGTDRTVSYAVFRHVDRSGEQVWQDASGYDLKQPTHWMLLPSPPTDSK
jgi:hypothetical protein